MYIICIDGSFRAKYYVLSKQYMIKYDTILNGMMFAKKIV